MSDEKLTKKKLARATELSAMNPEWLGMSERRETLSLLAELAQSVQASDQAIPLALRDVERHALYVMLEYTMANPGLDPTARKLLRELYERSAPTKFGDAQ